MCLNEEDLENLNIIDAAEDIEEETISAEEDSTYIKWTFQ